MVPKAAAKALAKKKAAKKKAAKITATWATGKKTTAHSKRIAANRIAAKKIAAKRNKIINRTADVSFPPEPASKRLLQKAAKGYCNEMKPAAFEEAGCAVCGQLTLQNDLLCSLDVLDRECVTRQQRFSSADPIVELPGPVLDDTCDSVCDECETALTTKNMPPFALANGFWIGNVPPQLKNLSFAEGMLIARIRHNRCLIRVSSGRAKMIANIIMFSNPILKVYKELPPKKDELEEILVFIFTGSAQPTPEDFERTPMFVRRNKVAEALEWLKLNHRDYEDIVISRENLDSYALAGVPVAVDFRRTNKEDGNKLVTQMSVHDSEDDEGTTNGSCPFTVHGLTGPEYEQM
ncbi:hypothetical protein C8R44DRAFT_641734, partial [Mycena epipterygia]